eukprot:g80116.t1
MHRQYFLARCYSLGAGVPRDEANESKLYTQAANNTMPRRSARKLLIPGLLVGCHGQRNYYDADNNLLGPR